MVFLSLPLYKGQQGRKWQKLAEMDFRALCAMTIEVTRYKKVTRHKKRQKGIKMEARNKNGRKKGR